MKRRLILTRVFFSYKTEIVRTKETSCFMKNCLPFGSCLPLCFIVFPVSPSFLSHLLSSPSSILPISFPPPFFPLSSSSSPLQTEENLGLFRKSYGVTSHPNPGDILSHLMVNNSSIQVQALTVEPSWVFLRVSTPSSPAFSSYLISILPRLSLYFYIKYIS